MKRYNISEGLPQRMDEVHKCKPATDSGNLSRQLEQALIDKKPLVHYVHYVHYVEVYSSHQIVKNILHDLGPVSSSL